MPPGRWTHLLTGRVVEGPGWQRETHGFSSLPPLVRPGALRALGAHDDRPDYDYAGGVGLRLYELVDSASVTAAVLNIDGGAAATFVARREGGRVTTERLGPAKPWKLAVIGTDQVVTAAAETAQVKVSVM